MVIKSEEDLVYMMLVIFFAISLFILAISLSTFLSSLLTELNFWS